MSDTTTSEILGLKWRVIQLEEALSQRDHRLSLAATYDNAKGQRIKQLEAELAEWRKLREQDYLAVQLAEGIPALLSIPHVELLLVKLQVAAESPE